MSHITNRYFSLLIKSVNVHLSEKSLKNFLGSTFVLYILIRVYISVYYVSEFRSNVISFIN